MLYHIAVMNAVILQRQCKLGRKNLGLNVAKQFMLTL